MAAVLTPTFGQLLRHHRLHNGLSQEKLAEAANLSVNQISDLERDQRARPHPDTLRRLADALALTDRERDTFIALARPGRATQLTPTRPRLPLPLTRYFATPETLVTVERRLKGARLLTLTGAGGVGKTRLALETAHAVASEYPDGVWLIDLASLRDGALVAQRVARTLGLPEQVGQSAEGALLAGLGDQRLLLVLDNCEHLLGACARLIDTLLRHCPEIRVLATSREMLRIDGEHIWPVTPLAVPPVNWAGVAEGAKAYPAVALFADRAAAVDPGFTLTPGNVATVAQICQRLDGIPLAIELAAARVSGLPLGELAARLEDRFRLLTEGSRAAAPRHQTLRAALEWGDDLLTEAERALLRRLSVFAGGWTLAAAEQVVREEGIAANAVADLLGRLVTKSLVQAEHVGDDLRYRLLEMVRQYAAEQLAADGETAYWQGRHAEYFLALAEEAAPEVAAGERNDWVDRLGVEQDNLRAALRRLIAQGASEEAVRLAGALGRYWRWQQHYREGRRWLEGALALHPPASDAARARALEALGDVTRHQGDFAAARAALEEALILLEAMGDRPGYGRALQNLGIIALDHEIPPDNTRATALFEEFLTVQRELNNERGIVVALNSLGAAAMMRGEFALAWDYFERVLARARAAGSERMVAIAHVNFGIVGLMWGDDARSRAHIAEVLRGVVLPEDSVVVAYGLAVLAGLVSHAGRPVEAARLAGASEAVCAAIGFAMPAAHRARFDRKVAREQLDVATWTAAWSAGHALTLEEALTLALAHC